jgi:hypothetical protein
MRGFRRQKAGRSGDKHRRGETQAEAGQIEQIDYPVVVRVEVVQIRRLAGDRIERRLERGQVEQIDNPLPVASPHSRNRP